MNQNKNERKAYLDIAKGIAVLCVIFGHIVPDGYYIHQLIYSFHMQLFFVVAGILLIQRAEYKISWKVFIIKKTRSLLLPYFFWSFFAIVIEIIKNLILEAPINITEYIDYVFSFFGIGALWFLPALFLGECIVFFIIKIKNNICINAIIQIAILFVIWIYGKHIVVNWSGGELPQNYILFLSIRILISICCILIGINYVLILEKIEFNKIFVKSKKYLIL